MLLSIMERLVVMNLLPRQGNVTTLRLIKETESMVGFTDEELAKLNFVQGPKSMNWDDKDKDGNATVVPVDVELGPTAIGLIKDALRKKEKASELAMDELPLYDRMMEDNDGKEDS